MNTESAPKPHSKPPALSHMILFFLLPCLVFMGWATYKIVDYVMAPKSQPGVFERLDNIKNARSPGDRWQSAYALAQDLQRQMRDHGGRLDFNNDERARLFGTFNELLEKHGVDTRLKRYLLLTIGQLGELEGVETLKRGLNESEAELRFFSAWGISNILLKNPSSIKAEDATLAESWAQDADPSLRKIAATFLVQQKVKDSSSVLTQLLKDSENEVRWNTAVALASQKRSEGRDVLMELFDLQTLRSANVRTQKDLMQLVGAAYQAAQSLNDPSVYAAIEKLKSQVKGDTPEGRAILAALR